MFGGFCRKDSFQKKNFNKGTCLGSHFDRLAEIARQPGHVFG